MPNEQNVVRVEEITRVVTITVVNFLESRFMEEAQCQRLKDQLITLLEEPVRKSIVLNLRGVEYFDESAIGKLLTFYKETSTRRVKVVFCNLCENIRESFEIKKIDKILSITSSEEEAFIEVSKPLPVLSDWDYQLGFARILGRNPKDVSRISVVRNEYGNAIEITGTVFISGTMLEEQIQRALRK